MRTSTRVLAGAGVLGLTAAVSVVIVSPLLLTAPSQHVGTLTSTGQGSFLDRSTGGLVPGTFTQVSTIRGREGHSSTTAVYDQSSTSSFNGTVIATSALTQTFDRRTGAGEPHQLGDTLGTTAHLFKLPFGTQKRTYTAWDDTAHKAVPLVFQGSTTIKGVTLYVFSRSVAATNLGPLPVFRALPGSWLGHPTVASIPVDEWYENPASTLWVEPVTGSLVGGTSSPHLWAQTAAGEKLDLLRVTSATPVAADAASLLSRAERARDQVLRLRRAPWVLAALGVLLLLAAVARERLSRKVPEPAAVSVPAPREPLVEPVHQSS